MARAPRRAPAAPTEILDPRFEGSAYSNAECQFLVEHLGEPSLVAMPPGEELPEGVNEAQVGPILDRTYQLELFQANQRLKLNDDTLEIWVGFERLRHILQETVIWRNTVQNLKRRTRNASAELRRASGAPSLHMWDPDTDIPYLGGIGADADRTLTALDADGVRIPLYTEIQQGAEGSIRSLAGIAKFVRSSSHAEQQGKLAQTTPSELIYTHHETTSTIMCPICMKSEEYETLKPSTKQAALARMLKHLKQVALKRDQHQLLLTRVKSGRAGSSRNRKRVEHLEAGVGG